MILNHFFVRRSSTWTALIARIRQNIKKGKPNAIPAPPSPLQQVIQPIPKPRPFLPEFTIVMPMIRGSHRKLNLLTQAIIGIPMPEAIVQMRMSPKKLAENVLKTLMLARQRILNMVLPIPLAGQRQAEIATEQQKIEAEQLLHKFVIKGASVGRGPYLNRIDYKGRGRHGIIRRPHTTMQLIIGTVDEAKRVDKLIRPHNYYYKENPVVRSRLDY